MSSQQPTPQPSFDALLFGEEHPLPEQGNRKADPNPAPTTASVAVPASLPPVPQAKPWAGAPLQAVAREEQAETNSKADRARAQVEAGIASLAAALEAGNSDAFTAYLSTMSRFHHYSLNNTILIAFQRPDATHVAGFHTWKSLGRTVIKGEKGIMILAPIPKRLRAEGEETSESGLDQRTETKEKTLPGGVWGFRVVYVFDVSQTEGKELPQFAKVAGDPAAKLDTLKNLVSKEGITLAYSSGLGGAYGVSLSGRIEILSGLTPAHEFSVLTHELAHELLHRDPLRRAETTRTVRETEAEAVAFVVCQAIGLDTSTQHADYIKLYRGSAETLAASLGAIQETATRIIAFLEEKEKCSELP